MADDQHDEALTAEIASARNILSGNAGLLLAQARQGGLVVTVRFGSDAVWVILRRGGDDDGGEGGIALRLPVFGADATVRVLPSDGLMAAVQWRSATGSATLRLSGDHFGLEQVRAHYDFTPAVELRLGRLPRDVIVFDCKGQPARSGFTLEAQQRKMNTGLLYFKLDRPALGAVLYVQNLSSLNPYFNATGSKPENAVQCDWPELGYSPPLNPETNQAILPRGKTLVLYDTILAVRAYPQCEEGDSAWQFLDMIGAIYPWISPPKAEFRDWPARAEASVHDL